MKLRFEVDQAEAFRQGVDVQQSIVTIEVDPKKLPQDIRNLIADRLDGINVHELLKGGKKAWYDPEPENPNATPKPSRIVAKLPTWESLLEAVKANEAKIRSEQLKAVR